MKYLTERTCADPKNAARNSWKIANTGGRTAGTYRKITSRLAVAGNTSLPFRGHDFRVIEMQIAPFAKRLNPGS
jgi:hypothetical protein